MVRKMKLAVLPVLQLILLLVTPSAHGNPGISPKALEASIRTCNAQEGSRLKALFRQVGELPPRKDSFGPSERYAAGVAKLPPSPFTFYFYAFGMNGDDGNRLKGRSCTVPFVKYDPESGSVEFNPHLSYVDKSDFSESASITDKLRSIEVHSEERDIRPYIAATTYGAKIQVTGSVRDAYQFAVVDEATAPNRRSLDVSASINMSPEEARALLPRLVLKLTVQPVFTADPDMSRIYLRRVRQNGPKISFPVDLTFVTHTMTGRLLAFEIFDPSTSQVYVSLPDLLKPMEPKIKKGS